MTPATAGHRLEHALFLGVSALVRALPERWGLALGAGLGAFVGRGLRIRRSVVDENLARAFPERSERWRRSVAVASYRHLGRESAALLRLDARTPEEVRDRVKVTGIEAVREEIEGGRGVLLLTGHLGNWEMGGAAVAAHGLPIDVVAKRQRNPLFERRLRGTRERLGMTVIYRHEATREILRSLRGARAVALVADQNERTGGMFVDFFGVPAATVRGPGLLAARTGVRVFTALPFRVEAPEARYHLVLAPLDVPSVGTLEADARALTEAYHRALEGAIREAPEQYFWFHRRWKTRPEPEEPGEVREVPDPPAQEDRPSDGASAGGPAGATTSGGVD